ncbi:spondin domain-containing protein [Anabaena sp. UHCC 0399]|uniref:spondin domain-containing protein n=1 Tax=Anabaena sp. UHCC 0399 TaxID=3110238 RepID=UPI002B221609|nr:spondin domain-containing protein [Anabaena sp. UHCC 0399]MEA5565394.1 spondin domain-containing protein [Anabaena sp. UHCC 0399]
MNNQHLAAFLNHQSIVTMAFGVFSALTMTSAATAGTLKVTVENLAPQQGVVVTPLWVGFHDGNFDIFNSGEVASSSLERLAEDGSTAPIANQFLASGTGLIEGTIFGPGISPTSPPVIPPGEIASRIFEVDSSLASSHYFSYAAMIVPSNDAFIANGNPLTFKIFDDAGKFIGADFIVSGNNIWDAGTEVNDEIPGNTALLGQTTPNTGVTENGVVRLHPGFIPGGNILSAFPNADFTTSGYQVARIKIEQVPEPGNTTGLLITGGLLWMGYRFRKQFSLGIEETDRVKRML